MIIMYDVGFLLLELICLTQRVEREPSHQNSMIMKPVLAQRRKSKRNSKSPNRGKKRRVALLTHFFLILKNKDIPP